MLIGGALAGSRGQVLFKDRSGKEVGLYRESHALLIGESRYTAGWPDLTAVPGELEKVEDMLQAQGFRVVKHLDLEGGDLRKAITDFIGRYGFAKDNRLLIYFAGHGHTLERGYGQEMGYVVPSDAPDPRQDRTGFLRKAVSMSQVLTWAREIEAKHVLFLFDSCFSGSVFAARDLPEVPPHISDLTAEPVRQFITAGKADQTVPAQSVFAPAFVDAIGHRLADLDKDGYVTGTELGMYLQRKVPQFARQTPQNPQYGKMPDYVLSRGDFVFQVGLPPEPAEREPAPPSERAGQTFRDRLKDGSEGPEMLRLQAGCFEMGSPEGEEGRVGDERHHRVCLDEFALAITETTARDFRRFVEATGYRTRSEQGDGCSYWTGSEWKTEAARTWRDPGFPQEDNYPVVCVAWGDALAYAKWLSGQTGKPYRLPTEAEWEYAARAGTSTARFWGDEPSRACLYANVHDRASHQTLGIPWEPHQCDDGYPRSAPAGSFAPNPWGYYDLLGNVWEWTCSNYQADFGGSEERCASEASSEKRVVRGGSWYSRAWNVRSAARPANDRNARSVILGFRVARDGS